MEDDDDYKSHANTLKDRGNDAFQAGNTQEAIQLYTQAIDLDPDNHVFYSNRSAAYMKSDSKSKALHDAEKCLSLAPTWSKGYARLGAAQQSLKRFETAIDTFKKGIELDAANQSLWSSLRACQEAFEADKKVRFASAATEREREAERLRLIDKTKAAATAAAEALKTKKVESVPHEKSADDLEGFFQEIGSFGGSVASSSSAQNPANLDSRTEEKSSNLEDDLLSGFFTEVLNKEKEKEKAEKVVRDETLLTEKYTTQDLGDAMTQYERLMAKHYEWRNLNPYYVLQLDIDATDEDIKQRYRKLAAKLHPDKMRGVENARECFEEVSGSTVV